MTIKAKLVIGSLLNVLLFGAANLMVGQPERAIRKILIMIGYYVFVAVLVTGLGNVSGQLMEWVQWLLAVLYVVFALYDGVFTILQANDVAL
ncbi:MAG: hypothetical protein WAZ19_12380 [Anaerolineae bacterium]